MDKRKHAPPKPDPQSEEDCREHREQLLDEALRDTFPASDPPAVTRPPARSC